MLGSIVEKYEPFTGSAIKISSGGFPTISRRRNDHKLRDINDRNDAPTQITRTTTIHGNGPLSPSVTDPSGTGSTILANRDGNLSDNDRSIDEFNANRVMSMSKEELQSALEEVKSLLSDKSINFLSRENVKSQRKQLHRSSDEGKHDPLPINLPPVNSGGPVTVEATGITTPLVDSVRFDLNGCIVIDKAIVMKRMVEELSQLLRPSAPGSHDELHSIVQACLDEMMPLAVTSQDDPDLHDKFFMLVTSSSQHLPSSDQDKISLAASSSSSSSSPSSLSSAELMHHQNEPHREGYNFSEINEVRGCDAHGTTNDWSVLLTA